VFWVKKEQASLKLKLCPRNLKHGVYSTRVSVYITFTLFVLDPRVYTCWRRGFSVLRNNQNL